MTNRIRARAPLMAATLVAAVCSAAVWPAAIGAADDDTITLTLQHMETPQFRVDAFQKAIDGFNTSQSKYFVKQETVDWGSAYQRVTAQIQAGNVADMQQAIPAFFTTIRSTGKLPPATAVYERLAEDYDFEPAYVAQYDWDDEVWAVPTWGMVEATWYDKKMLEAEGLTVPTTWDETLEVAKALTGDGVYGYTGPAGKTFNGLQVLYTFMLSNGSGDIYDDDCNPIIDNEQTVKAFEFYKELLENSPPDSGSYNWAEVSTAFVSGRAGLIIFKGDPIATWSDITDIYGETFGKDPADLGIAPIPVPDSGPKTDLSLSYSNGIMVMTEDPERQEGIYQFLKYFLSPDVYGEWLGVSQPGLFLPVTKEGAAADTFWNSPLIAAFTPQVEEILKINANSALYGFTQKSYCPAVGAFEGELTLAAGLERMMAGGMAPADAVKWVSDQMKSQQ